MSKVTGGGGGGGVVTIPGDPGELSRASGVYANVSATMASAAGQLRSSLGDAADWQGAGASAHAVRVQALAAAHQVGSDALSAASQALSAYARELTEAQSLAKQANAEAAEATATSVKLVNAMSAASTASNVAPRSGVASRLAGPGISPAQAADAKVSALQSTFNDQQNASTNLGIQALNLATAAAARATAAFAKVAQMAGSSSLHGSSNPWDSYLGVSKPGQAATLIQSAYNLGGTPPDGDNSALTDLAADPGEDGTDRSLAGKDAAANTAASKRVAKDIALLRKRGITSPMPAGWGNLSPEDRAAELTRLLAAIKREPARHENGFLSALGMVFAAGIQESGVGPAMSWLSRTTGTTIGVGGNLEVYGMGPLSGMVGLTYYATPDGGNAMTETAGGGLSSATSFGVDLTAGPSVSNAEVPSDLGKDFTYYSASAGSDDVATGTVQLGENSQGRLIWVGYVGYGPDSGANLDPLLGGAPVAFGEGANYTWVQPMSALNLP